MHRIQVVAVVIALLLVAAAAAILLRPGGPVQRARVAGPHRPHTDVSLSGSVRTAARSVVRVLGIAPGCGKRIEGTGFVYAPERVLTVAHVVAGVKDPHVTADGTKMRADVVYFDPRKDVAVLRVPGLGSSSLPFHADARGGDRALVAGYPGDAETVSLLGAWIKAKEPAVGPDIYAAGSVRRMVYTFGPLRSGHDLVRPGDSGGPLLAPDGSVYGMTFAADRDDADLGYALTAAELAAPAKTGTAATDPVPTGDCAA